MITKSVVCEKNNFKFSLALTFSDPRLYAFLIARKIASNIHTLMYNQFSSVSKLQD